MLQTWDTEQLHFVCAEKNTQKRQDLEAKKFFKKNEKFLMDHPFCMPINWWRL